jgi:DNA-binding PadR family transcriptional regulator
MSREVRLTLQTLQVLRILLNDPSGEHYGLEVSRSSGLPTGSIYPILTRLETAGWVISAWEEIDESEAGRRRRRYYQLTTYGSRKAQDAVHNVLSELAGDSPSAANPGGSLPDGVTA